MDQIFNKVECGICSKAAVLAYAAHTGYKRSTTFDIYGCDNCGARFAWPLKEDPEIYDLIYKKASIMPAYARYYSYAQTTAIMEQPLAFLASVEDVYWGVAHYLESAWPQSTRPAEILEIGSGLGYLTFALRKAGHNATAIELSKTAVMQARATFGPWYKCQCMEQHLAIASSKYDLVIATEVIEHIADVKGFVTTALKLLKPGGSLVITTPNKDFQEAKVLWDTDLPPVHFWWLGEKALEALATVLACTVKVIDMTEYNASHLSFRKTHIPKKTPTRMPIFDHDNNLLCPVPAQTSKWKTILRRILKEGLLYRTMQTCRMRLSGYEQVSGPRGRTLCAVFQPAKP